MKIKVIGRKNSEYKVKYCKDKGYWYGEINTTSTPISIVSKDGERYFISMLSGGFSDAIGLYHMSCTKDELQKSVDVFLEQIKIADDTEAI